MDVVKESLYVEEKQGANQLLFDGELGSVNNRQSGVDCTVV